MTTWLNKLEPYKEFLDAGTNAGLRYNDSAKSRYQSFKICMEAMGKIAAPKILELGTCRSYVDGAYEGCNSDDLKYWKPMEPQYWDWGAGAFSILMHLCMPRDMQIHTLDLIESHLDRWFNMFNSFVGEDYRRGWARIHSSSVDYLNSTDEKYDLIYIDTGDMWPIEPTCELQLQEARAIVENNVLSQGGLLLIDDVLNGTPREQGDLNNQFGKSELALPYLLENGFEIVFPGYQYILKRKN